VNWRLFSILLSSVLIAFLLGSAVAQEPSSAVEREWPFPAALVKRDLERLKAYDGQRLPTLEGFVTAQVKHLELYEQPYYQYHVTITPIDSKSSKVKVEAKITAYFADLRTAHSEYRTLPSNGRLESDLLDRLSRQLPSVAATNSTGVQPIAADPTSSLRAESATPAPAVHHEAIGIGSAPPSIASAAASSGMSSVGASVSGPEQQLDSVLAQRQTVREKSDSVQAQIQALQSGKLSVAHPEFASVRHSGVGVMSRTNYGGPIIFRAQEEDQFEVVEIQGEWTKVKLGASASSSATTGWIETDELTIPDSVRAAAAKPEAPQGQPTAAPMQQAKTAVAPASHKPADLGFWVSREEVTTFAGDWSHLKGKSVLYVYAQPRGLLSDLASDDTRLAYAKRIFETRVEKSTSSTPYDGIVVVFLGTKGGVAAATLGDIRQWVQGSLPDGAFVSRCSVDLPGQLAVSRAE